MRIFHCSRQFVSTSHVPIFLAFGACLCLSAVARPQAASAQQQSQIHDWLQIPSSVEAEHSELRAELTQLTHSGGKTADAAEKLQEELRPHFEKEEKYALPPLGLLVTLSQGKATHDMRPAIALSDQLKAQLPEMVIEHQAIKAAAQNLESAGREENKPEAIAFAEQLLLHAQNSPPANPGESQCLLRDQ